MTSNRFSYFAGQPLFTNGCLLVARQQQQQKKDYSAGENKIWQFPFISFLGKITLHPFFTHHKCKSLEMEITKFSTAIVLP